MAIKLLYIIRRNSLVSSRGHYSSVKRILFATFLVAVFSQIVIADDKNVVKNLLKERFDAISTALKNKDLNDKTKKGKIEDIIKPIFDFPTMSKLALGKAFWTSMTKEDQKIFSELFIIKFKQDYLCKIPSYVGEDIIIEEPKPDQTNKKKINIPAFFVSKNQKIPVLFMFYKFKTGWKIYDVEVNSISLIQSYRSQFTECLQEGTVKELIVKIEKNITSR